MNHIRLWRGWPIAALFSLTLLVAAWAAAQQPVQERAAQWLVDHHIAAMRDLESRREALRSAQAAVKQAEDALRLAREYRDAQAEPIAAQAVATAQKARDLAQKKLDEAERVEKNLAQHLKNVASGPAPTALPLDVKGEAVLISGGREVPLSRAVNIQPGDRIRVGSGSYARIIMPSGDQIEVRENSELTLKKELTPREVIVNELIRGAARVNRRFSPPSGGARAALDEVLYRAVSAVVAVRGTDFASGLRPAGAASPMSIWPRASARRSARMAASHSRAIRSPARLCMRSAPGERTSGEVDALLLRGFLPQIP